MKKLIERWRRNERSIFVIAEKLKHRSYPEKKPGNRRYGGCNIKTQPFTYKINGNTSEEVIFEEPQLQ